MAVWCFQYDLNVSKIRSFISKHKNDSLFQQSFIDYFILGEFEEAHLIAVQYILCTHEAILRLTAAFIRSTFKRSLHQ